jgi:hypothetical protein
MDHVIQVEMKLKQVDCLKYLNVGNKTTCLAALVKLQGFCQENKYNIVFTKPYIKLKPRPANYMTHIYQGLPTL